MATFSGPASLSQSDATIRYSDAQAEHHRTRTFPEEFLAIRARHDIDYDPRYLWG